MIIFERKICVIAGKVVPDVCRGEFYNFKNKRNELPSSSGIYAGLLRADLPASWHKG